MKFKRNKDAEIAVLKYDDDTYDGINRTRFYTWLGIKHDSTAVDIVTYAVKANNHGQKFAQAVIIANTATTKFWARNIAYHYMCGYTVDWFEQGMYKTRPEWSTCGVWSSAKYTNESTMWKLHKPVVNMVELLRHPHYKFCAYTQSCGNIYDYLRTYNAHPRVELLVKAGAEHLACKTGLIKRLESNRDFAAFFRKNINTVCDGKYGVDVIYRSFKTGESIYAASHAMQVQRLVQRECGNAVPPCVDRVRLAAYTSAQQIFMYEYGCYAKDCATVGLDMADTKNAFPTHFKRRSKAVAREAVAVKELREAKRIEEIAKQLNDVAQKYLAIERARGQFACVLPRTFEDFKAEGKAMHHCVGEVKYAERVAAGESLIVFIRDPKNKNTHIATLEIDRKVFSVKQCYGKNNSKPDPEVLDLANDVALFAKKASARRSA